MPPDLSLAPGARPSAHQKLTLYAGGALVVLIVLVIIALSSRVQRRPLSLVPKGQREVQVVDMRRFLRSPIYQMLCAAEHPIARHLEAIEQDYNVDLDHDVALVVDTDDSTILIGRFDARRMRDSFEEAIEDKEKDINRGRATPIHLEILDGDVEGYTYLYCNQEGVDRAFATVGSAVACFGDRWGVRRFLKAKAGLRDRVLDDPSMAAAYSPSLARGALLYRLEKPSGKILASKLKDVLGSAGAGVVGAFFAVNTTRDAVQLTIRLAARDAAAAQSLQEQLDRSATQAVLGPLLGLDTAARVERSGVIVTLASVVPLSKFEEIVVKDKNGQAPNLVLSLIAN